MYKFCPSIVVLAWGLMLTGTGPASAQTGPTTRPATVAEKAAIGVPKADHHTHVWSRDASRLASSPPLPEIEVPAELADLLKRREELVKTKDPAQLAAIYTDDPAVLNPLTPAWIKGQDAVTWVAESVGSFRLVPAWYVMDAEWAAIAGTYAIGEGEERQHVSNFSLTLRKGEDGQWRIAVETLTAKGPPSPDAVTAEELVAELDAAGVERAAVLSVAFWYGEAGVPQFGRDEYENVKAENDWVVEQAAQYPGRLVPMGSVAPLRPYAVQEIERLATIPAVKGLKLHLGNSDVDLRNPEHAAKVRDVFAAANRHGLGIVIHLRSGNDYGPAHSEAFLNDVLPAAPDIPVQIAHMAATGPGYTNDDAFEVLARAAEAKDPRMKNVYVDVASSVTDGTSPQGLELVARRLRQFGIDRVVFGSDRSAGFGNDAPGDAWKAFLRLPLTAEEFGTVAGNVAPHLR